MGLPDIFDSAQPNSFEQSLMMTTFELASWLVAFIAIVTFVIAVIGIIHLIRSEAKGTPARLKPLRNAPLRFKRPASSRKVQPLELHLGHRFSIHR